MGNVTKILRHLYDVGVLMGMFAFYIVVLTFGTIVFGIAKQLSGLRTTGDRIKQRAGSAR